MGRKKDISPTKVAQIVVLHEQGWTQRAIASKFNISQVTVQQRLKNYEKTGEFKAKKRTGRKRKTTTVTDRLIHRKVRSNPTISSSHLVSQLPTNVKISARTQFVEDFKTILIYQPTVLRSNQNFQKRMSQTD